jgi:imidazolonepropionase-like amidohydrolase
MHFARPASACLARLAVLALCCAALLPAAQAAAPALRAIRGIKIYPAPDVPPIPDGVLLVRGDRIVGVGPREAAPAEVPALAPGCDGGVIVAGFQNSHVHLNGPAFADARTAPAARLEAGLAELLTRHGFTTAFDIASDRANTLALANA